MKDGARKASTVGSSSKTVITIYEITICMLSDFYLSKQPIMCDSQTGHTVWKQ